VLNVWGNEGISPRILNLGTKWRLVIVFRLQPIYTRGKSFQYPVERRLGGPEIQPYFTQWRREKCLSLKRIEPRSSDL
jgi:hypothetical protein